MHDALPTFDRLKIDAPDGNDANTPNVVVSLNVFYLDGCTR